MSGTGPTPRKIAKVEHESYGYEEEPQEFDEETRQALDELDLCQSEIEGLNEKASEEILSVEQKFNKLRKPYYDKRTVIIETIPNFWVTAMINHPRISLLIDEDEEDCLHFLKNLEVEESEDIKTGYRIKLSFDENPFFENDVLVKEFHLDTDGNPVSTCSEIKWKKDMNILKQKSKTLSWRGKRGLEIKTFFSWMSDHEDPSDDEIAEIIKDELWSNPLQYYLVSDDENEVGVNEEGSEEGDESEDDESLVTFDEEEEQENEQEYEDQENVAAGAEGGEEDTLHEEEEEEA